MLPVALYLTMDRPTAVASSTAAGGSSRSRTSSPASRTSAAGDGDPDISLDELMMRKCKIRARHQALSELDVVEDIIEGFSIASFKSLQDLEVRAFLQRRFFISYYFYIRGTLTKCGAIELYY